MLGRLLRWSLVLLLLLLGGAAGVYAAHQDEVHGPGLASPPPSTSLAELLPMARIADPFALEAVRRDYAKTGPAAVIVIRDGELLAEWGATARRIDAHSVRKSLVSSLYGIAAERGLIDLEATLADLGIDDRPPLTVREKKARIVDLLTCRSGIYHDSVKNDTEEGRPARDAHAADTVFFYNNWSFNALGTILTEVTGLELGEAFHRWIAEPIGMQDFRPEDVVWITGDESRFPAYRFRISARDLARFGVLYLRRGRWQGRQVVPEQWVERSARSYSEIGTIGYGYMWWTRPDGSYYGTGTGGQKVLVDPSRDLVAVQRVDTGQGLGRAMWALFGPRVHQPIFLDMIDRIVAAVDGQESKQSEVTFERTDDRVRVTLDAKPFTEYRFAGFPVPILYPVLGPGGVAMTRNYPMKEGVAGEATDHVHHRSLWFTHGAVNGIDFWAGKGRIEQEEIDTDEDKGVLRARNRWIGPDGDVVCRDERTLRFGKIGGGPFLDFDVTLIADRGPVLLGDTKEGTMAIRVAPSLRLKGEVARGAIRNSEGLVDGEAWGKRARWVDYTGPVEGRVVGITLMDHRQNARHPSWWHARDYGLLAANPFGAHDFEGAEPGTGDLRLAEGERLRLRYRFWFHDGAVRPEEIESVYRDFAGQEGR